LLCLEQIKKQKTGNLNSHLPTAVKGAATSFIYYYSVDAKPRMSSKNKLLVPRWDSYCLNLENGVVLVNTRDTILVKMGLELDEDLIYEENVHGAS
jgi:hypothetical protein